MRKFIVLIPFLFMLSMLMVQSLIVPVFSESFERPVPKKIAPDHQREKEFQPQNRPRYKPSEVNRMYLFEHIHRSVQRAKKGSVV